MNPSSTRHATIIAQDPSVRSGGKILRAEVPIPVERLALGPRGHRVHVIDFDSTTGTLYRPSRESLNADSPFANWTDDRLLSDPGFHAWNVYAIVMRTLARFESALGRRVSWGFPGHKLKIAPHAFADANAFYSREDQALLFGYFPGEKGVVHTCLSHDVVAHETTHALLDGLRERFIDPTSTDQAAFHEGFGDIVALLSVFSQREVVGAVLAFSLPTGLPYRIRSAALKGPALKKSVLLGLAEQMGRELTARRGDALRRSTELKPSPKYLESPEFQESHRRGEILVAAMMNSMLQVWIKRIEKVGRIDARDLHRQYVIEDAVKSADHLLTMAIRALDYTPPVNLKFGDFLSALLTADAETFPDDSKFGYRKILRDTFGSYGIRPASGGEGGIWQQREQDMDYRWTNFEVIRRDPDEVFRFIWENRDTLKLYPDATTRVISLRPCVRTGADGFVLRETVTEYLQRLELRADELKGIGMKAPRGMKPDAKVILYGGGTLIFDQYGRVKYHVRSRLLNAKRQLGHIGHLARAAEVEVPGGRGPFAAMHLRLGLGRGVDRKEGF